MPGNAERAFTFPRPGPKTIQVTAFAPPASAAPAPRRTSGISDGTSNTIQLGETTTGAPGDGSVLTGTSTRGRTVCLSNLFVQDPAVEVRVNVTGPGGPDSDSRKTF